MITDVDVAVVGAGVAGLTAAAAVRAAGRSCTLIEASGRIGGRAFTDCPAALAGAWFDHGATWLHAAERNPLADIARAAGETLIDSDAVRRSRLYIGTHVANAEETRTYHAAWAEFETMARARAQIAPDIAFADAMAPMRANPWAATIELWEAAQIAAADPARLSLRDWWVNDLDGQNLIVEGGIGAFVARRLGAMAGPVMRDTPATRICWNDGIHVETARGTLHAQAAIVTVSTGVLAAGLPFTPALPAAMQAAIAGLPMGLLTKIALPACGTDRLGLPETLSLRRQVTPGEPSMSFTAWPFGRPYIQSFLGGPTAWDLSRAGPAATEDFARAQLRTLLGSHADRTLGPAVVTSWGEDPWHRGSYAYATVGNAGARAILATPLASGRLVFAGEAACTDGLAGTVGGAYRSGAAAAAGVLSALA